MQDEDIPLPKKCIEYGTNVVAGFTILAFCLVWMYRDSRRKNKKDYFGPYAARKKS